MQLGGSDGGGGGLFRNLAPEVVEHVILASIRFAMS